MRRRRATAVQQQKSWGVGNARAGSEGQGEEGPPGKGPGMEPKTLLCPFATLLSFLAGLQRRNPNM